MEQVHRQDTGAWNDAGVTQPAVPSAPVSALPENVVLLDVREDDEWAAGHATGALHIPLAEVPARLAELGEGTVHVVCKSGGRSAQAVAWLNQNGVDAVNVEGGTTAWAQAGKPMEATGSAAPTVL